MNHTTKHYNEPLLKEHYAHILEQNKEVLLQGGSGDAYLTAPQTDTRMAVALLIRVKGTVTENITAYLQTLQKAEPALYYYPPQDFHITVLDILRGKPHRTIPQNIADYITCIAQCVETIKPFHIDFQGVTASDNAVLVCGYYEYGLEQIRQTLRTAFAQNNLLIEERYQTTSSHITVARIPKQLNNPASFLEQIQRELFFGTMKVDTLELTFHNWYDSQKIKLADIPL